MADVLCEAVQQAVHGGVGALLAADVQHNMTVVHHQRALILLTTWFQYNGTYFTTYKESGTRRLTLAERLRKLPLSFFGKRDLADLTSTIMADCEVLEKDCSYFIPGLFGSLISTVLIALSQIGRASCRERV